VDHRLDGLFEAARLVDPFEENDMNDLTQKLILSMVIVPVLFGIFRGPKEMGLAAAAITVAMFFANLDKFSRFKGAGIDAELKTAVSDAYAAIEQLKELGLSVSSPIVDELAVSGRMLQYLPLKNKLEQVEKIRQTLRKLGASDKEINETCSTLYDRVTEDHMGRILHGLRESNPGKESLFEGLDTGKMSGWDRSKLEKFINDNGLKKNGETEEWIRDLDYFLETRKLRREDEWQS
jgi:hypothetical protein